MDKNVCFSKKKCHLFWYFGSINVLDENLIVCKIIRLFSFREKPWSRCSKGSFAQRTVGPVVQTESDKGAFVKPRDPDENVQGTACKRTYRWQHLGKAHWCWISCLLSVGVWNLIISFLDKEHLLNKLILFTRGGVYVKLFKRGGHYVAYKYMLPESIPFTEFFLKN